MASVLKPFSRVASVVQRGVGLTTSKRSLHQTNARYAITQFQMPAMSPTMTEGGIAGWKKGEGEAFSAGDVLLEIETDKATIDVEAQDDGIMGKILAPDGTKNIPVGQIIAFLAEEGDDISNIEVPKQQAAPPTPRQEASSQSPVVDSSVQPTPQPSEPPTLLSHALPSHARPLFPSVHRLLLENNISDPGKIPGTGVRGMITKGDVLTFLGKASGPNGTFKQSPSPIEEGNKLLQKKEEVKIKPLNGPAIRRLIVLSMLQTSLKKRNPPTAFADADFDSVISDYLPPTPKPPSKVTSTTPSSKSPSFIDGLI